MGVSIKYGDTDVGSTFVWGVSRLPEIILDESNFPTEDMIV
jgi:hypothetical protein